MKSLKRSVGLVAIGLFLTGTAAVARAAVATPGDGPSFWSSNGGGRGPDGRWTMDFDRGDGRVQLEMTRGSAGHRSQSSDSYRLEDFRGLARPAAAAGEAPARFQLVRDAGTFAFEGHLDSTGGSGKFHFTESADFQRAWQTQGGGQEPLSFEQQFSFAMHDVSRAFIADLKSLGYDNVGPDKLIAMRIHGVSPEFIRELASLGYGKLSTDKLIAFRIHGVSPAGIRELASLGYQKISADQLIAMRIHGATPEFVRGLVELGYKNLPSDELVSMRIHGVSPEYIRDFQELGYRQIPAEDLVSMRIHGVEPDYVRDLQKMGYRDVPVDDLVSMRIHGVTIEFVRDVQRRDKNASIDEIVSRRIHGRT
jgi:hypothetical protein